MRTELDSFMTAWQNAWFTKNASAIANMTSDDYVYVAPNGGVMDREAIVGIAADPTYELTSGTHTEQHAVMLGANAALVRRRWQGAGTYQGHTFTDDHRCVTICDRSSGRWLVRFEQCSSVSS